MSPDPRGCQWIEPISGGASVEQVRLFCFPHAGGGVRMYREWSKLFPEQLRLYAILLPGRESRILEPPVADLDTLLAQLTSSIRPYLDVPFAFFGHSMGAMISWELARSLYHSDGISPAHMFVSGSRALPYLNDDRVDARSMSDEELIEALRKMGGTEQGVLDDPDLMDMLLPCIRADYGLIDDYVYRPGVSLACPATALGGDGDPDVPADELGRWAELTSGDVDVHVYPGQHFFVRTHSLEIADLIKARLRDQPCREKAAIRSRYAPRIA